MCVSVYTVWRYEGCKIHLRVRCNESAITQRLASLTSAAAAAAAVTFLGFCGILAMNFWIGHLHMKIQYIFLSCLSLPLNNGGL